MKKIFYTLIILIGFVNFSQAQTYFFDVKQMEFKNYRIKENELNSIVYKNRAHYANTTLSQPIIFRRTNTGFNPNPIIMYSFTPTDSIVRRIYLEIDSLNFLLQTYQEMSGYKENINRLKDFDKQYEIIRNELVSRFGNPNETQPLRKQDNYYSRKDKWNSDSLDIDMYLTFCGPTNSANRIRAHIDFKLKKEENSLSPIEPKSNPKQDSISQLYLSLIFKGDYKTSWELLDGSVKEKYSYQDYVNAVTPIYELSEKRKEKNINLFFNGVRFSQTGTIPFYSYKFNSDKSNPPKTIIDVMFKDAGSLKIINVIPKQWI
jgi:hypothetical protein